MIERQPKNDPDIPQADMPVPADTQATTGEKSHGPSTWEIFKKNLPVKDFLLGFVIPKGLFYLGFHYHSLLLGAVMALAYGVSFFTYTYVKKKEFELFSFLAVVFILIRTVALLLRDTPSVAFLSASVDSFIFSIIYFGSLLAKRSLIQIIVDSASANQIPEKIRNAPFYPGTWRIVTAVWGIANLASGIGLIYLKQYNQEAAALFDTLSGWPMTALLLLFSIEFPKRYWKRILSNQKGFSNS